MWESPLLLSDGPRQWHLGNAHVAMCLKDGMLRSSVCYVPHMAEACKPSEPYQGLWEFDDTYKTLDTVYNESKPLSLRPGIVDRPVVARPKIPMTIQPGMEITLYILMPVTMDVMQEDEQLLSFTTRQLSNTWFGQPTEGELAYSLKAYLETNILAAHPRGYQCVTPLVLHNESDDALLLQRLCLRTDYLALFQQHEELWSNAVRLSYRGDDSLLHLNYEKSAPTQIAGAPCVRDARDEYSEGLLKRTFSSLQLLS